ncbi:MAG: hypothetical protein AAF993_04305 [Pseudomonadota bacterium]
MRNNSNHTKPFRQSLLLTLVNAFSLLLASMSPGALASGVQHIIVCTDNRGHRTFTEPALARRCADTSADHPAEKHSGDQPATIAIQALQPLAAPALRLAPLTETERKQLQNLQQRQQKGQRLRRQKRNKAWQQQQRLRADNKALCTRYRQQLDNLATRRRRGYTLTDSANLDAESESLKREYRQACR